MAYYPDLSRYEYHKSIMPVSAINIGWLDASYDYKKGASSQEFINNLWHFCRITVVRTRGFHICNLCNRINNAPITVINNNGDKISMGWSEIRVFSPDGKIFAAPSMVYHYVTEHLYLPPNEFIHAVLRGPQPDSEHYKNALSAIGLLDNFSYPQCSHNMR